MTGTENRLLRARIVKPLLASKYKYFEASLEFPRSCKDHNICSGVNMKMAKEMAEHQDGPG